MARDVTSPRRVRSKRYPNPRLVKIHRSYTVEEIARSFGKHKNTVREWLKAGLPSCDKKRPRLILGRYLASFFEARRAQHKRLCRPGEIYCVRCRAPKSPAGEMADYVPVTATIGNLEAICPDCSSIMSRRVNLAKLEQVRGKIDITFPQALQPFKLLPSVFGNQVSHTAKAQDSAEPPLIYLPLHQVLAVNTETNRIKSDGCL